MNPVHSAMATAVDRHNTAETNVIKRMAEQQEIIAELRRQLREVRAENAELRLKADSTPSLFTERGAGGEVVRPAVTISQYLKTSSLTYMQVYRALRGDTKGMKLAGYQDPSRQWWVYTA